MLISPRISLDHSKSKKSDFNPSFYYEVSLTIRPDTLAYMQCISYFA